MKDALWKRCLLLATYDGLPVRRFGVDLWVLEVGDSWDCWDLSGHPLALWPCLP